MSWQQQILRVDLSTGDCKIEPLNMEWAQDYLGRLWAAGPTLPGPYRPHRCLSGHVSQGR
jgi:aldehyde:ferredoxin oxidoreductase